MSLFTNIGQGVGTASNTGFRPLLPPIVMGVMAKLNAGIDLSHTHWSWLESWVVIAILAVLFVGGWITDRTGTNPIRRGGRDPESLPEFMVLAAIAGALVFAGSLADGHRASWPGLVAGAVIGFIATFAFAQLFMRANRRLASAGDPGVLLGLSRDLLTIALTVLVILVDVAGYAVALAAIVLLIRARTRGDEKYEGLRILR